MTRVIVDVPSGYMLQIKAIKNPNDWDNPRNCINFSTKWIDMVSYDGKNWYTENRTDRNEI